ncbi:hypothetical protein L210DRAFT_3512240 [Boletus edulis BED1]|uniref:Uncharacterized protein n=1 Tax=Boletus edulis BED1 TaxID=1328754 RepID=A0AAD4BB98_BOLED|nr:hypothetical protein L210DRAFT_3512240 [Boletus edulis BED1]
MDIRMSTTSLQLEPSPSSFDTEYKQVQLTITNIMEVNQASNDMNRPDEGHWASLTEDEFARIEAYERERSNEDELARYEAMEEYESLCTCMCVDNDSYDSFTHYCDVIECRRHGSSWSWFEKAKEQEMEQEEMEQATYEHEALQAMYEQEALEQLRQHYEDMMELYQEGEDEGEDDLYDMMV